MSKSTGQIVGGVLGAIGGFFVGGPAGAVKGALIGSSIGGMIDPPPGPDLKGPTLEDKSFNSAAYGVSLATLHGTIAHTGSIIYLENNEYKAVAKKQKTGGKGGGSKGSYTTTTYFATFAVAIGEAMPGSSLRRIWAGGKLIASFDGDADSVDQSNLNAAGWRYYDGTQTEPDSRMEATLGVGNCPSYEGTAYIIFYDFELTEYGNGLQGCPIKVEVVQVDISESGGDIPPEKIFESVEQFPSFFYIFGDYEDNKGYISSVDSAGMVGVTRYFTGSYRSQEAKQFHLSGGGWTSYDTPLYWTGDDYIFGINDARRAVTNWRDVNSVVNSGVNEFKYVFGYQARFGHTAVVGGGGIFFDGAALSHPVDIYDNPIPLYAVAISETFDGSEFGGNLFAINSGNIYKLSSSGAIVASRVTNNPTDFDKYSLWHSENKLYRLLKVPISGYDHHFYVYDDTTLDLVRTISFNFPVAEDFRFSVSNGIINLAYSTRQSVSSTVSEFHYERWKIDNFVRVTKSPLVPVVASIFGACGIDSAFYDLSALNDDEITGYRVTEASSGRGQLGPLQVAYLFDLVEDGYTLKSVKRGGSSIATIPLSKCGARGAGESPGVLVRRDRETESQLPSRYSLTYIDYNREYDTNTQYADYPSRAVSERNQQLPIVLSANQAAKLVDVLINLAWAERFSYEFIWPQEYAYLKPSNVVTAEVAVGVFVVLRITNITYGADQRVQVSARRAEPAVYQSSAVGIEVAPPSENIPIIVAANTVIMDLPAITDDVTVYGFGVAMAGSQTWRGGALLRSVDTGQTYDAIQAFAANCTIARATNYLPAGDYFVIDRTSELIINVIAGDFFSITEAQMLTGKHYCAYGADGRWEIIQYASATVISSSATKLTTIVRGLFGTEWAGDLHQANDMLVLLDDPDTAFIGADAVALNSPRKFKGVTTGQDAQLIDEIDFTYRGTNLKPLSPVNVTGTLISEEWTISFTKRTRMASNQWATGIAAPIGETALLFEFEFYEGSVFKKMYQSVTETFVYSAVNQMADFGYLPTTLTVKIYQISAVIGRGFGVEKTLIGVGDIYGDNVGLLLHFTGADNSTSITDSSKTPKSVAVVGGAKISTARSKWGGSSLLVDGNGDAASVSGLVIGSGDFTIEGWIYVESPASVFILFDSREADLSTTGFAFYVRSTQKLTFATGSPFVATEGTTNVTANTLLPFPGLQPT